MGLDMSILDLDYTHNYISKSDCETIGLQHYSNLPESGYRNYIIQTVLKEYSDIQLGRVGAIKDGKDFKTDTPRRNEQMTRSRWSNKIHNSGVPIIGSHQVV